MSKKTAHQEPEFFKEAAIYVLATDDEQGIVEAIVNVFGIVDDGSDEIQLGSFKKTIAERFGRFRVLDSHNSRSVLSIVGTCLAIREMTRDELPPEIIAKYPNATGGLYTKTQYQIDTPEGFGVYRRIKSGAIKEYSIGLDILDSRYEKRQVEGKEVVVRVITTVRLWEYSPVAWGMNPATATVSVKADEPDYVTKDDPATEERKEWTPEGAVPRVGDYMIACVYQTMSGKLGMFLEDGIINSAEFNTLNALVTQIISTLQGGIPEDVALRPMPMMGLGDWLFMFENDHEAAQKFRQALLVADQETARALLMARLKVMADKSADNGAEIVEVGSPSAPTKDELLAAIDNSLTTLLAQEVIQ